MKIKTIIATGAVSLALVACVTNPITGRKSVQIVGNEQLSAIKVNWLEVVISSKVLGSTLICDVHEYKKESNPKKLK